MFIASTAGGQTFAFPNVCKTPSASGTITIPYASTGSFSSADSDSVSMKVTIDNKYVCTTDTSIGSTSGDSGGVSGGVISGEFGGACAPQSGSLKVNIEGSAAVRFLDPVGSNGDSANAYGSAISPSQTRVIAMT